LAEGSQEVVISYVGTEETFTTNCNVTLVEGSSQVGNTDNSTAWWTAFTSNITVAANTTESITLHCYSNGLNNWHSPATILRKADLVEYAVVRMDNFGWGNGYAGSTLTSDWNWDVFTANINGSKIIITVTNHGNNKADILYNVTYANGAEHFQKYEGITVDSSDLTFAVTTEGAYLVIE
jgi:hypothetical protein